MSNNKLEKIGVLDQLTIWIMFGEGESFIQICVKMADEVDVEILKKAVESNLKIFPNFRKKLVTHRNKFFYVDNAKEAPVFKNSNESRCFCTEDTNDYAFYVAHEDNNIYFRLVHFISDGTGIQLFASFVINTYLRDRYPGEYEFDEVAEMKNSPFEDIAEPVDLFEKVKNKKILADYNVKGKAYSIECLDHLLNKDRLVVEMPEDKVVGLSKELGVTPIAVFASVFNKAVKNAYQLEDAVLTVDIMTDLRRRTGIYTLRNFTGAVHLKVNSDDMKPDLKDEIKAAGERFKAIFENTDFFLPAQKGLAKVFQKAPGSIRTKMNVAKKILGDPDKGVTTCHVTYMRGIEESDWKRSKVIGSDYELFATGSTVPFIQIFSSDGVMKWEFTLLTDRKKFGGEISKALSELGIECEIKERRAVFNDSFEIDRLENVK